MKTVAVYGGSFDPVHLGHVMVVTHLLLNDPSIDEILVVPCFQQRGKSLQPFLHRLEMCKRAFEWLPRTTVSTVEYALGGESITLRTMQQLKLESPERNLRFVMGSDLLNSAPAAWEGWDDLCEIAPPLVVGRAGIAPLGPGDPTPISPLISSTLVREALWEREWAKAGRYLPNKVLDFIREQNLYQFPQSV